MADEASVREVEVDALSRAHFTAHDATAASGGRSRRAVCYLIGDSITEQANDPMNAGWAALLQHKYVRSVDVINRGLSGYNTRWFVQHALPVIENELQHEYKPSLLTLFFGANDAALATGYAGGQHVPLGEYRANLAHIIRSLTPHLPPRAKILLITPPAIIDSARKGGERTNEAAGEYARACVDIAQAENVPVLDLYAFFNTRYPNEAARSTLFSDGLHLSAQGNAVTLALLEHAINDIFDDVELARFKTMQLPDFGTFL
uniref:SGNH hydrolase-type esterase domain-containing protein n=1 Tax=Globisporangium ultimum (strain ATCC 200006 / CBS 805.95 / DAOM BR144) TaxID=431595 RepID=K3X0Q9_GLOUD